MQRCSQSTRHFGSIAEREADAVAGVMMVVVPAMVVRSAVGRIGIVVALDDHRRRRGSNVCGGLHVPRPRLFLHGANHAVADLRIRQAD